MSEQAILVLNDTPAITPVREEIRIHVVDNANAIEIQSIETLAGQPVPVPLQKVGSTQQYLRSPSVSITNEEGGRGPIFNDGQLITAGVLLGLLADVVDEGQFTQALKDRLDAFRSEIDAMGLEIDAIDADLADNTDIIDVVNAQLEQAVLLVNDPIEGFVTNDETVTLSFLWPDRVPLVELSPGPGLAMVQDVDETDPDIHYVTIPDQELVYGHTGLIETATPGQYQFTAKAALLAYVAPYVNNLAWTSTNQVCSPASGFIKNSAACPLQAVNVDCMGFRAKGYIILTNDGATRCEAVAYVQVAINGGVWATIHRFKVIFVAGQTTPLTKAFDTFFAADQGSNTYQFRLRVVSIDESNPNQQLTASMHVATVTESGAGKILSNNVQLKWAAKE